MSSIFGKQTVAEPPYDILLERKHVDTSYEIRKYGKRFAATCAYAENGGDDMNSPFRTLARYIGVFGQAQNEGNRKISMTAPVVTSGTKIDMTAPVVTESIGSQKVMKFMLPAEYNDLSEIPKPIDPSVHIEEIPTQTGAVHRYNGSWDEERNLEIALHLGMQLIHDGVNMTQDYALDHWQFWGYNPPFTIPYFRRNEIWIQLDEEQVGHLMDNYAPGFATGTLSSEVQPYILKSGGLNAWEIWSLMFIGCLAVGFMNSRRTQQYSLL